MSPENYIRTRARTLLIGDCYINEDWHDSGFATITVTREHINGNITHGAFAVDLYCLGVRESFWKFNQNPHDFTEFLNLQKTMTEFGVRMVATNYTLVHNIIYGAAEFADELGFHPHKSFELAKYILEEDDERVKLINIEFGYKGKPLYISSPQNPAEKNRVLAHLDKKLGRNNFNFITEAEADDFFAKEDQTESNKIDYQDPEVKMNLISQFVTLAGSPKKILSKKPNKFVELIEIAEIILIEYMTTLDMMKIAIETISRLFDFTIASEHFSDDLLFGNMGVRKNRGGVRREAERLNNMTFSEKADEGLREVDKLINQYPDVPVFHYLYLRFMELKAGTRKCLSLFKEYAERYPGYYPIACLHASASLLDKYEYPPQHIPEKLHLKNFYVGKTAFCREEVLLYIHLLILDYSLSIDFVMIDVLIEYMDLHHPGIIPEREVFASKIIKVPKVFEWCEVWLGEQRKPGY